MAARPMFQDALRRPPPSEAWALKILARPLCPAVAARAHGHLLPPFPALVAPAQEDA